MSNCDVFSINENEYENFIKLHMYQLETSCVPNQFWRTAAHKLENLVYDAGQCFKMCQYYSESAEEKEFTWQIIVTAPNGIKTSDSNNIFLIDHAWTYQANEAKSALEECEGLLERMCSLMEIHFENADKKKLIQNVLKEMWKYNNTFCIGGNDHSLPYWYIMDEFGSRIQHDGDPNFRVIPFYYHPHQCCYSLLFPVKDVEEGEEVTRNYVETVPVDDVTRDAQMLPWFPVDMSHLDTQQEEPSIEYFQNELGGEKLPEFPCSCSQTHQPASVFTDQEYVMEFLTDSNFKVVDTQEEADIIWISSHFKDFLNLDNTWIIKPWNLGRGLDNTVTNNLNHILRLPATGPKIAQKYISKPVLFYREDIDVKVKFDLRFIVLLVGLRPLKVAVYRNFWIRFANKEFDMEDFEDYDKHFTVNNYNDSFLLQMFCHDFIKKFNIQYPSHDWSDLRRKINCLIKEVMEGATMYDDARGIIPNPQSRACYGFDVMIDWEERDTDKDVCVMQPKLLEVNFSSDCRRACEYYPNFFNDVFNVLFLEDRENEAVQWL